MPGRRLTLAIVLAVVALFTAVGTIAASSGFRTFVVPLEPQAPNDEGSGIAVVRLNPTTHEVCYLITVEGIGVPTEPAAGLGAAHIHDFATGGIFIDLETAWMQTGVDRFTTAGCVTADGTRIDAILADPGAYYVNIHTVMFPAGALIGALG
jgi:hypothetical protein